MNVNEVMTTPVRTCRSSTPLDEIARMMWEQDCGAIPVVTDSNELVESCVAKREQNGVRRILVTDDSGALCGIVSMGDAVAFTTSGKARNKNSVIGTEQVLGMLRKVSGHHQSGDHPLMQI